MPKQSGCLIPLGATCLMLLVVIVGVSYMKLDPPTHHTWTIKKTYGGSWEVFDEHGNDIAGGMSEQDARTDALRYAKKKGLNPPDIIKLKEEF